MGHIAIKQSKFMYAQRTIKKTTNSRCQYSFEEAHQSGLKKLTWRDLLTGSDVSQLASLSLLLRSLIEAKGRTEKWRFSEWKRQWSCLLSQVLLIEDGQSEGP